MSNQINKEFVNQYEKLKKRGKRFSNLIGQPGFSNYVLLNYTNFYNAFELKNADHVRQHKPAFIPSFIVIIFSSVMFKKIRKMRHLKIAKKNGVLRSQL